MFFGELRGFLRSPERFATGIQIEGGLRERTMGRQSLRTGFVADFAGAPVNVASRHGVPPQTASSVSSRLAVALFGTPVCCNPDAEPKTLGF